MTRRFRLATVERLRTARLEAGGRELVAAQGALDAARERRDLLAARLLASAVPPRSCGDDLVALQSRRQRLRDELAEADHQLAELVAATQAARAAWLRARAELRAVQTLHEQHRDRVQAEQLRAEQLAADERAALPRPRTGGQR